MKGYSEGERQRKISRDRHMDRKMESGRRER